MKSRGDTLKQLLNHFPSHLQSINWGAEFAPGEASAFYRNAPRNLMVGRSGGPNDLLTPEFIKGTSRFDMSVRGEIRPGAFNGITFPPTSSYSAWKPTDLGVGTLSSISAAQWRNTTYVSIRNSPIDPVDLRTMVMRLPRGLRSLRLAKVGIKLEDVDALISVLPRNLLSLDISGNLIGEEGLKKFRKFKDEIEAETELPLNLIE